MLRQVSRLSCLHTKAARIYKGSDIGALVILYLGLCRKLPPTPFVAGSV